MRKYYEYIVDEDDGHRDDVFGGFPGIGEMPEINMRSNPKTGFILK